ncbi:MAG: aldo/keto reductase [Elusimicrobia bacterium]|nr:aldo/keto reductase [Elusimicrobiota bacterium]
MSDSYGRGALPLNNGTGKIPALGFGTMIPDTDVTRLAVVSALESGYRLLDCAAQNGNEIQVGSALKAAIEGGAVRREDVTISTKLWNTNHRPERVKAAFDASRRRLGVEKIDLYMLHTPFAFPPEDEDAFGVTNGDASYDLNVTLLDTWQALESLVDEGVCGALGMANAGLDKIGMVYQSARIKPAVVQVEAHPYLPQDGTRTFCAERNIVLQASSPLGHGVDPRLLNDPVVYGVSQKLGKTPAQVLLAWALQRGTAPVAMSTSPDHIRENLDLVPLPQDLFANINMGITTRHRFNSVVENGVPDFAAKS